MATIIENYNELQGEYNISKRKKNITLILLIGTLLYIFTTVNFRNILFYYTPKLVEIVELSIYLAWLAVIIEAILYSYYKKKTNSLDAGIEGESKLKSIIRELPDDYKAVTNVKVQYDGKSSELDLVLIGKNGVFVIETKNHNGTIVGEVTNERWNQHKVGQNGGKYSNSLYNPIKQVSTHVYRLSNVFKAKGINVWVQGIVYFSNKSATVKINNTKEKVPVFAASSDGVYEIIQYINEYQSKSRIDSYLIDEMVRIVKN